MVQAGFVHSKISRGGSSSSLKTLSWYDIMEEGVALDQIMWDSVLELTEDDGTEIEVQGMWVDDQTS